jgi:hypothetical protein
MADFTPTSANVAPVTDPSKGIVTQIIVGQAGQSINAGIAVYQNSTVIPPSYWATTTNASTSASVVGIAMCNAGAAQPVEIAVDGDIYFGAGLSLNVGDYITLATTGSTAGWLNNNGLLGTSDFPNNVGIMVGTTQCRLCIATNNGVSR